jgi:hypothetical protein
VLNVLLISLEQTALIGIILDLPEGISTLADTFTFTTGKKNIYFIDLCDIWIFKVDTRLIKNGFFISYSKSGLERVRKSDLQ